MGQGSKAALQTGAWVPKGFSGGWRGAQGVMDKAQLGWHSCKGSAAAASRNMGFKTFDLVVKFLNL